MIVNEQLMKVEHVALGLGKYGASVFAVDPGETTGWAWALFTPEELKARPSAELFDAMKGERRMAHGQVSCWREMGETQSWMHAEAAAVAKIEWLMSRASDKTRRVTEDLTVWRWLAPRSVTHVVCEDFIIRERSMKRDLLSPIRITSPLFNSLHLWPEELHFLLQSPSDAKGGVTDESLKSLGLWHEGEQHARDASRHLVVWLRKFRQLLN